MIGSSLNAGFISGSPRFNYGKENYKILREAIDKRTRLRAVADSNGVDLRTAALQFSAAAYEAVALVVGASSAQQIREDWNSMQARSRGFLAGAEGRGSRSSGSGGAFSVIIAGEGWPHPLAATS